MCSDLGFPLKRDKVIGLTTSLVFLGIVLVTEAMELHLPDVKVTQLGETLNEWGRKRLCRKESSYLSLAS